MAQSTQAPSSPSWSVPLHRPPPGVVYETSPTSGTGTGTAPYPGLGGYAYPPPSGLQSEWSGVGPSSSYARGSGEWYIPQQEPNMYPPPPPPAAGPSYTSTPPQRDFVVDSSTPDQPKASVQARGKDKAGKKKRKKGSPVGETDKEKEKRTKTGRACDACVRTLYSPRSNPPPQTRTQGNWE